MTRLLLALLALPSPASADMSFPIPARPVATLAATAGILAQIRPSGEKLESIFGQDTLGLGTTLDLSGLRGEQRPDLFATQPLDVTRAGSGGGATIGLGNLGSIGYGGNRHVIGQARRDRASNVAIDICGRPYEDHCRHARRRLPEIRYCYEKALFRHPTLQGRVTVQFSIAPSGIVGAASIASSEIADEDLHSCILAAARRWRFPESPSPVSVRYPFSFKLPEE